MKHIALLLTVMLLALSFSTIAQPEYSYNYKEMKMDEYNAELSKWQNREATAKAGIEEQEGLISGLKDQVSTSEDEYNTTWAEIYALLGTDEAGYKEFLGQAEALENDLKGFLALSPEDIYSRRAELDEYKNRLAQLRKDKRSLGPDPYAALQRCEGLINQAEEKAKPAAMGKYEVIRGDYLWKIAKKPDIYGDPYAWMRIYTTNRTQIKDPDLIYPAQVFDIPRIARSGQHWVARGESLSSIARSYGTAFNWQRLYEANKESIGEDPNVIYPHMILSMP